MAEVLAGGCVRKKTVRTRAHFWTLFSNYYTIPFFL
jgi:hypothetical protein